MVASSPGRGGSFPGSHAALASSFCCRLLQEHLITISNVGLQINDTPCIDLYFLTLWILSICFQRRSFLFFDSPCVELYPPKRPSESIYNGFDGLGLTLFPGSVLVCVGLKVPSTRMGIFIAIRMPLPSNYSSTCFSSRTCPPLRLRTRSTMWKVCFLQY